MSDNFFRDSKRSKCKPYAEERRLHYYRSSFTDSLRFANLLAGNPSDNLAFHFHLKEGSE